MIPLAKPIITKEMKRTVLEVLESSKFILGENVGKFENEFSKYCNARYGIGVSSGTSALHLALLACGVGKGDEVIIPANTYVSTAFAVSYCGGKPIFVDIDDSYTLDTTRIEENITKNTKAIIPVHLYGHSCRMEEIMEIASERSLRVIEDCSQAHGAEFDGKKVGSFGDAGCFSLYPSKNMMCCGDGGIIVTNNENLDERIGLLRNYGTKEKNLHELVGYNSRLSEISAAIAREQLKHLDEWNEKRRQNAKVYDELLKDNVVIPKENFGKHVYHLYVIRTKRRDELKEFLFRNGIETGIHYPLTVYKQPCYNLKVNCHVAEKYSKEILSLPIFPELSKREIEFISENIKEFIHSANLR